MGDDGGEENSSDIRDGRGVALGWPGIARITLS